MNSEVQNDVKCASRLYIGNLDQRITESALIKMFSPFGEIVCVDFLWHTRGPKRGEPRGYAFIQYGSKEEARLAQAKMNGRRACGRPLVVSFASEKAGAEADSSRPTSSSKKPTATSGGGGGSSSRTSRSAVINAIRNKLRSLEEESGAARKRRVSPSAEAANQGAGGGRPAPGGRLKFHG